MEWLKKSTGRDWIILRIKGLKPEENDPHLLREDKDKDWNIIKSERFQQAEWYFKEVTFKDTTYTDKNWKEKPRRVFDLVLISSDWYEYHIWSAFTQVGRSILNTLISKESHWKIRVSVYLNKKWYPSASVYALWDWEDELLGWKIDVEGQKKLTVVTELPNGNKDYFRWELEKLLEAEAVKLTPAWELPEPTQTRTPTLPEGKETPFGADQETDEDDDFSDLPF